MQKTINEYIIFLHFLFDQDHAMLPLRQILASGLPAVGFALAGFALLTIPADEARAHVSTMATLHVGVAYPLHRAALRGDADSITHFLAAPHSRNVDEREGDRTPLHNAAGATFFGSSITESSRVSVVAALLMEEANPNLKDRAGWTPLHWAAFNGYVSVIAALVAEEKTEVNLKENQGITPLHLAAQRPDFYDSVVALIAAGADVTLTDTNGRTAAALGGRKRSSRHCRGAGGGGRGCECDRQLRRNAAAHCRRQ